MDGWSTLFTLAAAGGVLLTLFGSWWVVRTMRGRTPRPHDHDSEPHDP